MEGMDFHNLQQKMSANFGLLHTAYGNAYQTDADRDELWNIYIESIPARINQIYRTRREYDCSCCRHFIKDIGGIVFIDDELNLHTIWGFQVDDPDFQPVMDALDAYVKSRKITDVFLSRFASVGQKWNTGFVDGKMDSIIFVIASKEKYRYPYKGQITTEDLWDLTQTQLDSLFKTLNGERKVTEAESLLGSHTAEEQALLNKIEIVKYVFSAKREEAEAKKQRTVNAEKKRRIMELIASKEDAALGERSIEDLKKMLSDLDE